MAGTCPCGDFRCVCVRPCLCCSCTCSCNECRRLRKGPQYCDLCINATNNKTSNCGVVCTVTHKKRIKPQVIQEGSMDAISRRFRGESSGHSSSNAEAVFPKDPSTIKDETDEDSDEPMLEIDDIKCSSSESSDKCAEGSAANVPGCSKINHNINEPGCSKRNLNINVPGSSQPRRNENRRMIDLSGGVLLDANGNIINPEEYRKFIMSQRSPDASFSKSVATQESETTKDSPGCSQRDGTDSEKEKSKTTETTPVTESKSPEMSPKASSSDDSEPPDDKFFSILQSSASSSVSAPSAFSIPQPRSELERGQRMPSPQSSSPASTSRRLSMLRIWNAHSAEKGPSRESKSAVEPVPEEAAACGKNSDSDSDSGLNYCINELNNRLTSYADQEARKSKSPEKSENLNVSSAPDSPPKALAMEQSSDESDEEKPSTSNSTRNMSRKC